MPHELIEIVRDDPEPLPGVPDHDAEYQDGTPPEHDSLWACLFPAVIIPIVLALMWFGLEVMR